MKMTQNVKTLSLILCIVLVAAIALFTAGCGDKTTEPVTNYPDEVSVFAETDSNIQEQFSEVGIGDTSFDFSVIGVDGKESKFRINTDKKTVGEALLDAGLIAGENGPYGLYVKTVNGETVDYDTDGKYWAFYVDGEYALSGVDVTEIKEGTMYSFKVE